MDVIRRKGDASDVDEDEKRRNDAAIIIQRAWRHHHMRKQQLTANARWKDTIINTEKKALNNGAIEDKNDVRSRWQRGVFLAGRLQDGNALMTADEEGSEGLQEEAPEFTKSLEKQHWLELVDPKHRYGSNLKYYYQKWMQEDTTDNFFKWLDRGAGKSLSLPECDRKQLESERILYLSAEKRLNYLVKIDEDGKLRWERNNQYVDTAPGIWTDMGDGNGISRADGKDMPHIRKKEDSIGSSLSEGEAARHYHGVADDKNQNVFKRIWRDRFTTNGLMERLLRKTVRKNTWMYVTDTHYNMFVGLKETGHFQHSSFTGGGLVTSAGLIEVENGLVTNFSPLSGHYRTSTEHYKQFLHAMEERGLDLHKVHVTTGEMLLWGLEHWKAFTAAETAGKKKIKRATNAVIHPKKAKNDREKEKEKKPTPGEANTANQEHGEPGTAKSSTKPTIGMREDGALRIRAEQIRRKSQHDDERWRSGSQWRWEVITGKMQKRMQEDKEKWRVAMGPTKVPTEGSSTQQQISKLDDSTQRLSEGHATSSKNANHVEQLRLLEKTDPSTQSDTTEDSIPTPQERPPAYSNDETANPSAEKAAV